MIHELAEDLSDLADIAESGANRVRDFRADLAVSAHNYRPETHAYLLTCADALLASLERVAVRLRTPSDNLAETKRACADLLRTLYAEIGSVLSAGDWQSPSYLHTDVPEAGTKAGKVVGTMNDYTRDGHAEANAYERAFAAAYIDAPLRFPPHVFVTSSGMSAFSTVLFLLAARAHRGPAFMGASSYFENQWAVKRAFNGDVHLVDEMDTTAILEAAKRLKPSAVFLDTLCNAPTLAAPNLATLLPALDEALPQGSAIVLDNSALSLGCQPLQFLPRLRRNSRLFVIESLNKYHQFGFDRVTGGIIWTTGGIPDSGVSDARKHLGTVMPVASVLSLPAPDRPRLLRRLNRINRNALLLATRLQEHLAAHPSPFISHVVYPGLSSHPANGWIKDAAFQGGSLILAPRLALGNAALAKRFIGRAVEEAKKDGLELYAGSSFGFDTTRLYLTALFATHISKPFLRVSAGTESLDEIEAVATALIRAIERP